MQKPEFPKLSRKVRNRLAKLADFLNTFKVPKGAAFEIATFGVHDDGGHKPSENNFCGTQACALGWAALSKKFVKDGLVPEWEEIHGKMRLNTGYADFLDSDNTDFGIGAPHFDWLFMPDGYDGCPRPTAKTVAKRIREVLREQRS